MFAKAVEKGLKFIRPVVASRKCYDGTISTDGGTLVVINKDGYFISAAHLFEVIPMFQRDAQDIAVYHSAVTKLKKEDSQAARKELKKIKPNLKWIVASSLWPGEDGQKVTDISVIPEADVIVGRLEPFDSGKISEYPVFAKPSQELRPGMSLCKLGYAFSELKAEFDDATGKFSVDFRNLVPFPLDGIYTRDILLKSNKPAKIEPKFLETSSPGLRGHSGGPFLDINGRVCGIQSRTAHLPLGFSPSIKNMTENQFLNVGWGIHPEIISAFLKDKQIVFAEK